MLSYIHFTFKICRWLQSIQDSLDMESDQVVNPQNKKYEISRPARNMRSDTWPMLCLFSWREFSCLSYICIEKRTWTAVLHKFVSNNLKWFETSTATEKEHLRFEKRNTKKEEFYCRTFATINWRGPLSDHDTYLTSEEDSGGGGSSKLPCLSLLQRRRTPTKTTATSDENRGTVSGRSGFLSQFVTVNPILRIFPPLSLSRSLSLRLSFVNCGVAIFCSAFFTPRTGGPTQFQANSLPYCDEKGRWRGMIEPLQFSHPMVIFSKLSTHSRQSGREMQLWECEASIP